MRQVHLLLFLIAARALQGQPTLVINELQAANHRTITSTEGATPDWIEVYNGGRRPVDLLGMRIAINGRQHVIDGPLSVPAKGYRLLWCDERPKLGPDHLGFTLDRAGGTVLLIAADGVTIQDLFNYPALVRDVSMGRVPDGGRAWSFFPEPSPGRANPSDPSASIRRRAPLPEPDHASGSYVGAFDLRLASPEGIMVRYTLDGSTPTAAVGTILSGTICIDRNTVVRARCFGAGLLPGEELCATYLIGQAPTEGLALNLAPDDLWNDSTGIYVDGAFANHSRSGIAWERPGTVQRFGSDVLPVGVRISGSGSRGLAKRSFKLYGRDRYGSRDTCFAFADGTHCDEVMLRADAGPNAFLRNLLLEELVQRHGLNVEVQTSLPLPLYLNGEVWGLYRWMPPKDAQWVQQRSGAEAVDLLEGPAGMALAGNDSHFEKALQLLISGAPKDNIARRIDLGSLIDLACIDLYTGRADHDLNVRCYRPRQAGGRWRWILYDLDLWAPAEENSVERMCSDVVPGSPFIPQLLGHPELQQQLLARMSALLATAFDPGAARGIADGIFHKHRTALEADHQRWAGELDRPDPATSLRELDSFIAARPRPLMQYLAERSGRKLRELVIDVPPASAGTVLLEGLALAPGRHPVIVFSGVPMRVEARAAEGMEWTGWRGTKARSAILSTDASDVSRLSPRFSSLAP